MPPRSKAAPVPKTRVHYTAPYLINPQHRVTVDLIGLGGTGSQVLTMLGRLNATLAALDHPGLYVRAWDPDVVSDANIGRQLFSSAEVGLYKAACLMSRVNRFFGTDWEAQGQAYCTKTLKNCERQGSNITITCVDTIQARVEINTLLTGEVRASDFIAGVSERGRYVGVEPQDKGYYWLDFGNAQHTGQVVLGTLHAIERPASVPKDIEAVNMLPHVLAMFPDLATQKDEDSGPSCSLAEALLKQDLFINSTLCNLGMAILWKLFRELRIVHHGAFLNLQTMSTNPINV